MEESDEALIGRYARGESAAFDQLYKRHELRVWRSLERNLDDPATADDLLLEVWCALARHTSSAESTIRVRTRLFTLAHDRVTQLLDARGDQASLEVGADSAAAADGPANTLARAIEQLPREQRAAYLLQMEGQLSVGEIAQIAGSTIDAAQGHLRLARLKLQELFSEPT
jgi:RNA polymerase sigma factor (sigma-70 family)